MRVPAVFIVTVMMSFCVPTFADGMQSPAQATATAESSAQELEAKGDAFRSQKDFNSALDMYRKATQKTPKNAVLWNKIGMVELQIGAMATGQERSYHFMIARDNFQKAVKLKKDYAEAVNNIGVIYFQQEQYKKAIKQYQKALDIRQSASFHSNLGSVYFAQKNYDLALKEYMEALRMDPDVFERTSATGISGRVGRPEDRANYAMMLARLYAQAGDVDHSILQIRNALENGYQQLDPLYKDADFAEVRKDPRFAELMANKPTPLPD